WGSDKPRNPRQIVDAREAETLGADDLMADTSSFTDEYTDEEEDPMVVEKESDETETEMEPEVKTENLTQEPVKKDVVKQEPTVVKKEPVTEQKPKTTPPPATKTSQPITKPTSVAASADGKHLVIVGNFLQQVNANQRLQELKKAGFEDVEIVNFDLSEYHTVCAGRFDDVNEARRLVKKLKDYHKIDAYVRIGS
ncbi:MAG TPA: SPOR domain-containing protein, partial [Chryseolinea sp.]|nr:SPOR domain-containing protein [Chryseolinea sp.]